MREDYFFDFVSVGVNDVENVRVRTKEKGLVFGSGKLSGGETLHTPKPAIEWRSEFLPPLENCFDSH
jgi:hypothetical protein